MTRASFNWWLLYPTLSVVLLAGAPQAAGVTANVAKIEEQANVICQKAIDDRHLLRRVRTADGCFDEVIDTFTGHVDSRTPVPCDNSC